MDTFVRACFVQAEDGIRDGTVTGVQTCALPISVAIERPRRAVRLVVARRHRPNDRERAEGERRERRFRGEIGRASCRESGYVAVVVGRVKHTSANRAYELAMSLAVKAGNGSDPL